MDDLIGQTIGQYQIVSLLGVGGMSSVYRARQESMQRDVAIKVIKSDLMGHGDFVERFRREARTIASLSHPYILKVFDYGQYENTVYLVMELLNGGSLSSRISTDLLPLEKITRLLDEMAEALDYAHQRGIIHRDLKPQNVLLDEAQHAHLSDFGLAKLLTEATKYTQSGTIMGTPAYMSPEQWSGQPLDARADVYSLGVILFEMLSGQTPFNGETPYVLMHKHIYEAPPPLHELMPNLPAALEPVVNKALAKNREDRFVSAGEVASAFKKALTQGSNDSAIAPTADVTPTILSKAPASTRSSNKMMIAAAVVAVLVVAVIAVVALSRSAISNTPAISNTATIPAITPSSVASPTGQVIPTLSAQFAPATPIPTRLAKIAAGNISALDRVSSFGRGPVMASTISDDGKYLAVDDNIGLLLYDLRAPNNPPREISSLGGAFGMRFSKDQKWIGALHCGDSCDFRAVDFWNIETDQQLPRIQFAAQDYLGVDTSPDGKMLATGSDKETAALWDITTGKQTSQLTGVDNVSRLLFSPDGSLLAIGKTDHSILLWDVKAGKQIAVLQGHTAEVTSLAFSSDGSLLASGCDKPDDPTIRIWEVKTGKQLALLHDTNRNSSSTYNLVLMFSHDDSVLLANGSDTLRVWDAKKYTLVKTLDTYYVDSLTVLPDNARVVTHSQFGGVELLDITTGKSVSILPQAAEYIVAFSPDGKNLASSVGKYVYIRNSKTGAVRLILQGAPKVIFAVTYSPDGMTLAASSDGRVYLWNAQTGEPEQVLPASQEPMKDLAFSPDGGLLAGANDDGTVHIWEMKGRTTLRVLKGHDGVVTSVAFSPNGKILASGGADKTIRLWDAQSGTFMQALQGHDGAVTSVRFSPDGSFLASAGEDKTVRLWDTKTWGSTNVFTNDQNLTRVSFSSDSSLLAAAGDSFKFWDPKSGQELSNLDLYVTGFAFSPDDMMIATAGGGSTVIVGVQ